MNTFKMMKGSLTHPLDFFYDIQFGNRAKYRDAIIIIFLAICTKIFSLMLTGFSYSSVESYQVSVFYEALWIVLPWITWSIANWAVSAIADGEGKFKHIVISSSYVYVPYILFNIPLTIVSNVLTQKEGSIVSVLSFFTLLWMIFLILVHVKVLHDFDLGKTIWITLLSLFGVLLLWFMAIMIFGLVNQSVQFILNIFKEIGYRN